MQALQTAGLPCTQRAVVRAVVRCILLGIDVTGAFRARQHTCPQTDKGRSRINPVKERELNEWLHIKACEQQLRGWQVDLCLDGPEACVTCLSTVTSGRRGAANK
jgi:hypothetical protein